MYNRYIKRIFEVERVMNLRQQRYRSFILFCVDLLIVVFSLAAAAGIEGVDSETLNRGSNLTFCLFFVFMMAVLHGISFIILGIHRSLWTFIGAKELMVIGVTVVMPAIVGFMILRSYPLTDISPLRYTLLSVFMTYLGMSSLRMIYRAYRERVTSKQHNVDRQRALIVGAGEPGYVLLKELQRNPSFNTYVVGFIDSRRVGSIVSGKQVLGSEKDIVQIAQKHKIDLVYIAQGMSHGRKVKLIRELTGINIGVKVMRYDEVHAGKDIAHMVEDVSVEDLLGRGQVKLDQQEISSYLAGKNILVTGAGGSIGSQIVREVVKFKPKTIYMLDVNENELYMLDREISFVQRSLAKDEHQVEIKPVIVNIREELELDKLFASHDIQVVFHAAAHKHVPLMESRPQEAVKNNVFGTKNVIDCAIKYKAERFIMISTDKAVNPTNVMGASKRMTEMILQSRAGSTKTKLAAVRFGNVLGSNGSVIPIFKDQIKKGGPITLTDSKITRYFMTIPEAVQLVLQAGFYADKGDIFVLDMGKPVKIIDLATNLIKLAGLEPYVDIDIVETGLRPGEKMFEELFLDSESHTKTKNDLIYRNSHDKIDKVAVVNSLERLSELVAKNATPRQLKIELMKSIGQDTSLKKAENRTV